MPRGAIDQLLDYFGMMKLRFPDKAVEMMVVANVIPPERQQACESRYIECRAIPERKFRDVAAEVGYAFTSEVNSAKTPSETSVSLSSTTHTAGQIEARGWSFARTGQPLSDRQDFLSRCDKQGADFFAALFDAQKAASGQTKVTWNHQSGFSMQFYFHRLGFAPMVWGFPAKNRDGKHIRQRLDFPFDFAVKAGVPEAFVNEFGASLSSIVPLAGGGKRPSISLAEVPSSESLKIIEIIFAFAGKAKSSKT
jgi:hypothetical protein